MLNTPQQTKSRNWDTLAWHIHHVICADNKIVAEYLTKLLAYWVQNPEKFGEVAIALMGAKGIGKSAFARVVQDWFQEHFVRLMIPAQITNYFNAHFADALVVFVEEGFCRSDKQGENALKELLTVETIQINPKGSNSFSIPNRLKFLIASNKAKLAPIVADSQRCLVLNVSEAKRGDSVYFDKLHEAISSGESTAMLHDLLQYDLSTFNPHKRPC